MESSVLKTMITQNLLNLSFNKLLSMNQLQIKLEILAKKSALNSNLQKDSLKRLEISLKSA